MSNILDLITNKQIESNLRRTTEEGLISKLDKIQLLRLSLKYFGIKDEDGNYIGYICPYTGKEYYEYSELVLEHIVPVASKGGTVLFNCIPASKEANDTNQKGANHLIDWWKNSSFWKATDMYGRNGRDRLDLLVNYMLEGYKKVFSKYTEEELETIDDKYLDKISYDENKNDRKLEQEREEEERQAKKNGIHSYQTFFNDCIDELPRKEEYKQEFKELSKKYNVFGNVEKYSQVQNIYKKLIKEQLGNDTRSYLTYIINTNIQVLMESITFSDAQEIEEELRRRFDNINRICYENGIDINDYFKSIRDLENENILYYANPTEKQIKDFAEGIKLNFDSRIKTYIEMLNEDYKISANDKQNYFKGTRQKINGFWDAHKYEIIECLFEGKYNLPENSKAQEKVLNYLKTLGYSNLVDYKNNKKSKQEHPMLKKYIEMLNEDYQIKAIENDVCFKGTDKKIGTFWNKFKYEIIESLFEGKYNLPENSKAQENILNYLKNIGYNSLEDYKKNKKSKREPAMLKIYIEMLNEDYQIKTIENDVCFKGTDKKIAHFWSNNNIEVIDALFEGKYDLPENRKAQENVLKFLKHCGYNTLKDYKNKKRSKQEPAMLKIYIEMLNENYEIKSHENKIYFKETNQIIGTFWDQYKDEVIESLFGGKYDLPENKNAQDKVLNYLKSIGYNSLEDYKNKKKSKQEHPMLKTYIEMLNENYEIRNKDNKSCFKGTNQKINQFWNAYKIEVIDSLFGGKYDLPENKNAQDKVLNYLKSIGYNSLEDYKNKKRNKQEPAMLKTYIEMLNEDYQIKAFENESCFKETDKKIGSFWEQYKDEIIDSLFGGKYDLPENRKAQEKVLDFLKHCGYNTLKDYKNNKKSKPEHPMLKTYIEMLNEDYQIKAIENDVCFKETNQIVGFFWNNNNIEVIESLFGGKYDLPENRKAQENVLKFLKHCGYNTLNDYKNKKRNKQEPAMLKTYIEMLNEGLEIKFKDEDKEHKFKGTDKKIGRFWDQYKDEIIGSLFGGKYDLPENSKAQENVLKFLKHCGYNTLKDYKNKKRSKQEPAMLKTYIDMLNGDYIMKENDPDKNFMGTDKKIGYFWGNNNIEVIESLFGGKYDLPENKNAQDKVLNYLKSIGYNSLEDYKNKKKSKQEHPMLKTYIEMLNEDYQIKAFENESCFKETDKKIGSFWSSYKFDITYELFYGGYVASENENARNKILAYYKVNSIEEYITKLNAAKVKNNYLREIIKKVKEQNNILEIENENLMVNLNTSVR